MGKKRVLLPADEVDTRAEKYDPEVIQAPHLTGFMLKLFVKLVEAPMIGSLIIGQLKKQNKMAEILRNTVIPETPMFKPEFPPQEPEPGVIVLEDDVKSEDRVESALKCLPHYDPASSWIGDLTPFRYWKIRDYAYAYRSRLATPSMVAERIISAIEEFSNKKPPMPLLISFDAEEVRKQAAASTQRFEEGNPLSILDGIFMAIKDDIDCFPHPSKGATKWFHEVRSVKKDAVCVSRLRCCGVIFVGKANMHEMGLGTTGNNPNHGSLCDAGTVEIIGPLASTVEDVMLVYAAISGSSPADKICFKTLHGGMCKILSTIYCKVLGIFPDLEAARPRSTSGIQALCSLHIALEKTKNILQHCSECSKLYLAITGDSVVLKFEKARCALEDSLRRVEDIVPQAIGCQISEILSEIEGIEFSLTPLEKQVGDDIIALLQQGRKFNSNCGDTNELESFHQAASRLCITSSRAALRERRALKKLIERARAEEDKRKESIVAYLLHLMRKYSKLFRSDVSDDNDSQGSTPCSPTVQGSFEGCGGPEGNEQAFERQLSKLSSFNFKPNFRRSGQMAVPPEELRCPISLQLMYDPVIIASGQTYERICIEKWFSDGHNTCPKTQQQLSHLCLTPNYCVKGLVTSWCEQNGVVVPDGPPESLDLNYWRLALSEIESADSKLMDSIGSCKFKGMKVVPLEESVIIEETEGNEQEDVSAPEDEPEGEANVFGRYEEFLTILDKEENLRKKCRVVEQVRHLLRDDEEARIYMGANGFVEALMRFLESAVHKENEMAQEIGIMALFNLAVNNNRNKEMMLAAGVLPLLGKMVANSNSLSSATALYLNLSCLEEAKPIIGSSEAVAFLVEVLQGETDPQCKMDALHGLYNLSSLPSNIPRLLSAGIINGLQQALIKDSGDRMWTEKSIAVLINLALSKSARDDIISAPGLISGLSTILDIGEPIEQEQAAACLLILCNGNDKCIQMVLQEGVIPSLVSISVNGTMRGKQKSQKLLMLFREQRQREPPPVQIRELPESSEMIVPPEESKPLFKSISTRKFGKNLSYWWKNKSFTMYQC